MTKKSTPKKSTAISTIKNYSLDKPAEMLKMANTLKTYIVKQNLFTNIKGKNYVHTDGWQFAGFLTGMNAIVESVEDLSNDKEIKWRAKTKIYVNEKCISTGYAVCSSKETSKKNFDEYAILSMAQTRSLGKAYRNKLGWVMKLAGYQSTPAEEIKKVDGEQADIPTEPTYVKVDEKDMKNQIPCQGNCGAVCSPQVANYSKKMFKGKVYCKACQDERKK